MSGHTVQEITQLVHACSNINSSWHLMTVSSTAMALQGQLQATNQQQQLQQQQHQSTTWVPWVQLLLRVLPHQQLLQLQLRLLQEQQRSLPLTQFCCNRMPRR
jgi:hypothetical protein